MATFLNIANFSGYNGSHFYIVLNYDIISQSEETNQTVVRYNLYAGSTDGYSAYGSNANGYIGDTWVGSLSSIGVNSYNYVGSRDVTYTHNEDGTLTVYYWASFNTTWDGVNNASLSGNLALPKIDRYSIITNAENFTDEQSPTITFTNNGLYDLRAKALVGLTQVFSYNLTDSTVTSFTFDFTNAQRNQLRQLCTGKTMPVRLQIVSLEDGTEKYTSTQTVTMSMVNAEPTFTYTVVETNQNVIDLVQSSTATSIVDNASIVKITVTPSAKKQATISGVNVVSGGTTYTDTTSPYEISIPVTDNNFTISVTDSRGYTTTQIDSGRTLIDYEPLRINSYTFKRESPISSNIILNFEALYYDTIGSNVNTPIVKWKLDNGAFTTIPGSSYTIDSQNHKLTISNYEISNVLAYNLQGQFTIYIEDKLTNAQDTGANGLVLKGVATYDAGEHHLQVNGDLFIADINRDNAVNVLDAIQEAQTETYSTTETAIGEWIDGSTIYRKCFHTTNVGNTFTITHGISNYGTTVYSYISADRGIAGSSYVGGERPSGEYPLYITNINTTSINCKQSGFDDWDIYVILEYTKIS